MSAPRRLSRVIALGFVRQSHRIFPRTRSTNRPMNRKIKRKPMSALTTLVTQASTPHGLTAITDADAPVPVESIFCVIQALEMPGAGESASS